MRKAETEQLKRLRKPGLRRTTTEEDPLRAEEIPVNKEAEAVSGGQQAISRAKTRPVLVENEACVWPSWMLFARRPNWKASSLRDSTDCKYRNRRAGKTTAKRAKEDR